MFNAIVKIDFLEVEGVVVVILLEKTGDRFGSVVAKCGSEIVGCSYELRDGFEWDVFTIVR